MSAMPTWIINRLIDEGESALQAESGSKEDVRLERLARADILTCYDSMFGNNYYSFTAGGRRLVVSR